MRIAYFDCFSGISGDMTLGALLSCGIDESNFRTELSKLNLPGWELRIEPTSQNGIGGTDVTVIVTEEQGHGRHLHHIKEMLNAGDIATPVVDRAIEVFTRLAQAEAHIHQTTIENIHFHEVGAIDAIIDIVGACIALDMLHVDKVACSPLPYGRGFVECMHGTIPLPAPATLELLKGVPMIYVEEEGEFVTPTGAAIITTLTSNFGAMPTMSIEVTGYGSGKKRFGPKPNLLRVVIGQETA